MKSVLVLDGETRASLAVVRSLGRAGFRVIVGSKTKNSLAGTSRYCHRGIQYNAPEENMELFTQTLLDIIKIEKIDILFPVTDASTFAVLKNRSLFDEITSVPFVSFAAYRSASDKSALLKTAAELGIPCPATIFIDSPTLETLEQYLPTLTFPIIIKPHSSILATDNNLHKTSVHFAAKKEDLLQIITSDTSFRAPYMLQEVIQGEGIGIFAFCIEGEIISVFSHRRVREKPPYGGVSVVSESTQPDPSALESSKKLLRTLNWSGVAMVEFKQDRARNNIPVLMEINARFWGSLQLAIDAGINFPLHQCHLSNFLNPPKIQLNSCVNADQTFYTKKHTRSRWILGDLDHLIIRLKLPENDSRYPQRLSNKIYAIFLFFLEFFKGSKIEELRYGDIKPFWYALKMWIKK